MDTANSVSVIGVDGKTTGDVPVPSVFNTPLRLDVISKAVIAEQSHSFQRQGRNPMAGKRTTAEGFGVGRGISRVPRIGGHGPLSGQAAFAPGTRGGRLAFPPVSMANPAKSINRKERRFALRSALAASASASIVKKRGHRFEEEMMFPLVVSDAIEKITKTSEARKILFSLGLWDDIARVEKSRQTLRGRTTHKVGPLIVVGDYQGAHRAFRNFDGVDVVRAQDLSVENLAPGTHPGRLTVWSESAFKWIGARAW